MQARKGIGIPCPPKWIKTRTTTQKSLWFINPDFIYASYEQKHVDSGTEQGRILLFAYK